MTKRIPADERRQELMQVAERLFATRPYADISVQEIADEAGVARGLIHHYFGGKDDVLAAVMRELTPSRAPTPVDIDLPLEERVERRIDMLMDTLAEYSQPWLATLASGPNIPPGPLRDAAEGLWDAQYKVWLKSFGDVLTDNPRTKALYAAYRGLNQATCRMWLNGEMERADARLILVTAMVALLSKVGPALSDG
ncbi:MAG TPA: helix-turn-helix domain-containing protein [Solirubrobacterales bacterium]|nr:helix-turn-helix domain-containing protein [Solirubrobacterales bacterium]